MKIISQFEGSDDFSDEEEETKTEKMVETETEGSTHEVESVRKTKSAENLKSSSKEEKRKSKGVMVRHQSGRQTHGKGKDAEIPQEPGSTNSKAKVEIRENFFNRTVMRGNAFDFDWFRSKDCLELVFQVWEHLFGTFHKNPHYEDEIAQFYQNLESDDNP